MRLSKTSQYGPCLADGSMRITKETLFNILNLQTISSDGNMINLFSQRGDADYLIEVVGMTVCCNSYARSLDE